jgi:hypothetical protein
MYRIPVKVSRSAPPAIRALPALIISKGESEVTARKRDPRNDSYFRPTIGSGTCFRGDRI